MKYFDLLKSLIYLLDCIKLMAQWLRKALWTCMGISSMHARGIYIYIYQVYSLDPTIDLFIGLYRGLYKERVHALIVGIGSFEQISSCQI